VVCLIVCVCVLVMTVSPAKTDEPIEMTFGEQTRVSPRNPVIDEVQGPDLQNILRQSYDYLTIMPKLRSTYDKRLIYKTSYKERTAFLRYDSLAKLKDRLRYYS